MVWLRTAQPPAGPRGPGDTLQLQGQALSDPGSDILPFTAPRVSSVDLLTEPPSVECPLVLGLLVFCGTQFGKCQSFRPPRVGFPAADLQASRGQASVTVFAEDGALEYGFPYA